MRMLLSGKKSGAMKRLIQLVAAFALSVGTLGAADRVMIGDDVYVGPDEDLDEVVCILCSVRVDGKVKTAVAILGSVDIVGEVDDEAVAVIGSVRVRGKVGREAVAVMGRLDIDGEVGSDAVSVMGGVNLGPGASVGGDLVAVLGGVTRGAGSTVGGDVVIESEGLKPVAIGGAIVLGAAFLVFALVFWPFVAFVTYSILGERRSLTIMETISRRAGMSFLLGLGVGVSSLILPVALFWVPGIEAPLMAGLLAMAAVGYVGISLWVGRGLLRLDSPGAAVGWGAFLVSVLQLIPLVGWFAWWLFANMAIGGALLSGFGSSIDWLFRRAETQPIPRPAP